MSRAQDVSVSKIISMFSSGHGNDKASAGYESQDLDIYDQSQLLDLIETLNGKSRNLLFPYLRALLLGSQRGNSAISIERRGKVLISCIDNLKMGNFQGHERTELVELIFSLVRLLSVEHAQAYAERVLTDFTPSSAHNCNSVSGHCGTLELLPQLVMRAGEKCREYITDKICEMTWSAPAAVMLAAALVELSDSESECARTAAKISAHIHWSPSFSATVEENVSTSSRVCADAEDLPALMYQLTALSTKCGQGGLSTPTAAAAVRALVVDEVADSLDRLLDATLFPSPARGGGERITEEGDELSSLFTTDIAVGSSRRIGAASAAQTTRMNALLCTIMAHLSLLVSKDQGISTEIVRRIKARSLLQYQPIGRPGGRNRISSRLSCARLLLGLLAARAGRIESAVLNGLADTFAEVHAVLCGQGDLHSSLWFESALWQQAVRVRPEHLRRAFSQLLRGSLVVEAVAAPLVKLSFLLLSQKIPGANGQHIFSAGSHWSHISGASVVCLPSPVCDADGMVAGGAAEGEGGQWVISCAAFGAWLLHSTFLHCGHARLQIARELVLRLQLAGSGVDSSPAASSSTSFPSGANGHAQGDMERLLVGLLDRLATECAHGLVEVTPALQDVFLSLPNLHPITAGEVVRVLGPICAYTPSLADRCALALRKASFSKDIRSRQAAVNALSSLLRSQLLASANVCQGRPGAQSGISMLSCSSQDDICAASTRQPLSSGGRRGYAALSQQEQLSQRVSTGLSVDEVLSLCRRFLQHQAPVRAVLYDKLGGLQQDFPLFRPLLLRLAVVHLRGIITEGDQSTSVAVMTAEGGLDESVVLGDGYNGVLLLNIDRCVDGSACISEAICDLLLFATAMARDAYSVESVIPNGGANALSQDVTLHDMTWQELPPLSLGSSSSQRRSTRIGDRDAADLCQTLWRLSRGLSVGDLADYGLPPSISSAGEYRRMVVLVEAIQTAMVVVMAMPESFGGITIEYRHRTELVGALAVRLEGLSEQVLAFRKKVRDMEKERAKEKKAAGRGGGGNPMSTNGDGESLLSRGGESFGGISSLSQLPLPHLVGDLQGLQARLVMGAEHMYTQGIELELHCLCETLEALNHSAADLELDAEGEDVLDEDTVNMRRELRETAADAKVSLQESVSAPFLRHHLLERSLRAVEGALLYLEDIARFSRGQQPPVKGAGGGEQFVADWLQHVERSVFNLMSGVRELFCCLLKEMVRLRTEERELQHSRDEQHLCGSLVYPGVGAAVYLTTKQVVVRGLLGCVRAVALAGALSHFESCEGAADCEEKMQLMSAMLQRGFGRANIKRARVAAGDTQRGASALTAGVEGFVPPLDYQAKSFITLFLSMHGAGERTGELAEAPLVVCLLGELAGVMSEGLQEKFRALVLKHCGDKLQLPTPQLSTSLIQLLVLRAVRNPKDRCRVLLDIAEMVERASAASDSPSDEEGGGAEAPERHSRKPRCNATATETFTFVSVYTAGPSAVTVIGILDKMANEVDALSRLMAKSRMAFAISSSGGGAAAASSYAFGDSQRKALLLSCCDGDEGSGEDGVAMMDVDSAVYSTLNVCMRCAVKLLNLHSSTAVSLGVTSVLLKLYKIQVRLTKEVVSVISKKLLSSASAIRPAFREMSHHTTSVVNPSVQAYLTQIHNELDHKVSGAVAGKGARSKLSKSIPDLIYQMEQLDLCFIKLQATLRDKEKHVVSRWIKRSTARDFRLRTDLVEVEQDKARSAAMEKNIRRAQAGQRQKNGGTEDRGDYKARKVSGKKRASTSVGEYEEYARMDCGIAAEYYDDCGDREDYSDEEGREKHQRLNGCEVHDDGDEDADGLP